MNDYKEESTEKGGNSMIGEFSNNLFENIKHFDQDGNEYWEARELQSVLSYNKWENFYKVIKKAITSCNNSDINYKEHFLDIRKTLKMPNNATKEIIDYKLSRYACYLIAQNADSRKIVIALAQTYFAIQTRRQELNEKDYSLMSEDERRLYNRDIIRKGNYSLNQTAKKSGVKNFDRFHNAGYRGLYNGEAADDIFKRKKLRYREDILDNMGSEELADNIFRIAQTDAKLKRDNIKGETNCCITHYTVGNKIRKMIKELGGTMPEDLGVPSKSIKELNKDKIKLKK